MSKNIDFIIFAIKQAKEAEKFGFTRNECCRNLKTALHQYWQNKTMSLHGQSQKKNIPRSRIASTLLLSECVVEHMVPQMVIVNMLMDLDFINKRTYRANPPQIFSCMFGLKERRCSVKEALIESEVPAAQGCAAKINDASH